MTELADWIVGTSLAARTLDAEITAAAASDAKVLITGKTGVGKEMTARLLHYRSPRQNQPVIAINCAGVPDSLLESELFGHVRGSFTDAVRDKAGIFEAANGGTVFLVEVGEMSTRMQVVLLRFLETGEIQRIGADRSHTRVNVRLITATNRDLPELGRRALLRGRLAAELPGPCLRRHVLARRAAGHAALAGRLLARTGRGRRRRGGHPARRLPGEGR